MTGSNWRSPVVTGNEIGDKISAPKITNDFGEFMGVHERFGIGPPAVTGDHIYGDLRSSTMRYRISKPTNRILVVVENIKRI